MPPNNARAAHTGASVANQTQNVTFSHATHMDLSDRQTASTHSRTQRISTDHPTQTAANDRRTQIVEAARTLFEEKGLTHTSVKDITTSIGVTRSLFYHYFSDKSDITQAVLDLMVDDFIEMVHTWNENRETGNVKKSVKDVVRILRLGIFENNPLHKKLANIENAGLYLQFYSRTADALARYIVNTTAVDYAHLHKIKVDHLYETFYMLISGLITLIRTHPDIPDQVLEDLIEQTLHLEI